MGHSEEKGRAHSCSPNSRMAQPAAKGSREVRASVREISGLGPLCHCITKGPFQSVCPIQCELGSGEQANKSSLKAFVKNVALYLICFVWKGESGLRKRAPGRLLPTQDYVGLGTPPASTSQQAVGRNGRAVTESHCRSKYKGG